MIDKRIKYHCSSSFYWIIYIYLLYYICIPNFDSIGSLHQKLWPSFVCCVVLCNFVVVVVNVFVKKCVLKCYNAMDHKVRTEHMNQLACDMNRQTTVHYKYIKQYRWLIFTYELRFLADGLLRSCDFSQNLFRWVAISRTVYLMVLNSRRFLLKSVAISRSNTYAQHRWDYSQGCLKIKNDAWIEFFKDY